MKKGRVEFNLMCEIEAGLQAGQRIGTPYLEPPPEKVVAVVLSDDPDRNSPFKAPDETSRRIAGHILEFLSWEVQKGRIPANLLRFSAIFASWVGL